MNEIDMVRYDAFFDELSQIEKMGMLDKFAAIRPGFLEQLWRGGKQLFRSPGSFGTAISKGWHKGVGSAGEGSKLVKGLKGVWATPQGKAAIVGGGLAAGGIGTAGYLAGRKRGEQQQNVYVR